MSEATPVYVDIPDEEWAVIRQIVRREAIRQQAWPLGSSYQQQYLNRPWVPTRTVAQ